MSMLSQKDQSPFRALVRFTQGDITAYLNNALNRRGYTDVQIDYKYDENGSQLDRFAIPTLNATVAASKDGKPETETISSGDILETVFAELVSDGHTVDKASLSFGYSAMDRQVYGEVVLLVPRKRS